MRINQLHIKNFKGFEDRIFEFSEQVTVLIGDNATGKSSVLDALAIAAGTYLLGVEGISPIQIRSIQKEEIRSIYYENGNEEKQGIVEIEATGELKGEKITWKRTLETEKGRTTTKYAQKFIKKVRQLHNSSLLDSINDINPIIAYYGTGRLWVAHNKKTSSIKNIGYLDCLSSKSSVKEFIDFYQTIVSMVAEDDKLDKSILNDACENSILAMIEGGISMSYSHSRQDIIFTIKNKKTSATEIKPFKQLSDGYRSMISLVADIAFRSWCINPTFILPNQEQEGIVLIDEIDLHLHPNWQKHIIADLKRVFPKIQFIITTHSPFIVQGLKASELINLDGISPNGEPENHSLEENAMLMGVKDAKSKKFDEKTRVAEDYLKMVEKGKENIGEVERKKIMQDLDEMLIKFSDDPVFVAKLKIKKIAAFGEE